MNLQFLNNDKINKCPSIFSLNKDILKENMDSSSEEEIPTLKRFENNFNINFDTEWKTNLNETQNNGTKNKTGFDYNEITRFNFFIIIDKHSENIKEIKPLKNERNQKINKEITETKKRGRKRKREDNDHNEKGDDNNSHNKFSDDNLRKKCKNIVLKYALEFNNKKIKEKYKGNIGHGKFKKELKLLEQGKRQKSNVNFDKSFLKLSLKEIFSGDISARFNNFPKTYNKTLIDSLINDKDDEERKQYFNKLFNITFIDCLKYFIEIDKSFINELDGFTKISSIKEDLIKDHGKDYLELLIHYLQNLEEIINNKKERKPRRKTNKLFNSK